MKIRISDFVLVPMECFFPRDAVVLSTGLVLGLLLDRRGVL